MRFLQIYLGVGILFFVCGCYGQNLLGNIISVSVNQPCTDVDVSLTNTSNIFRCDLASVLQIGLSPQFSNESSSITYTFKAFPDSTGSYQQDFGPDVTPDTICAQPGTTACKNAVLNDDLFFITIELSPVNTRWKLINTGITIPSAYYYQTRPYGINSEAPLQSCGIDPYSDVANDPTSPYQYAKPINTVTIDKKNITSDFPSGAGVNSIYAQYLLSSYALSVPGENTLPPNECSIPGEDCSFFLTSVGGSGELTFQYGQGGVPVLDTIFNRWLNGTLGTGQAVSQNRLSGFAPWTNSATQCTQPIGSANTGTGPSNTYTTNVCPGNPLPGFKSRNNQIYPSYCINGPCGGTTEPFCALVAGFQYGFSRCMMSKEAAIQFLLPVGGTCTTQLIESSPFYSINQQDADNHALNWYACLQESYLYYQALYPDAANMIKSFLNAIDPGVCGTYLQEISFPSGGDHTQVCPYPVITHTIEASSQPRCTAPQYIESSSNPGNPWTTNAINVEDVRQFVVPFQDYNPDNFANTPPVGFCGSSNAAIAANENHRAISPTITTSPCTCTGMNGWQDTVMPIGPLGVVYRLENPGEPVYTMKVTVGDFSGTPPCEIILGPVAGEGGSSVLSGACNNTAAAFIINIDKPRGNVLPPMDGYIVVIGSITDDNPTNLPTVEPFFGGTDPTGQTDPYATLGSSRAYRTPLPSTFRDAFRTSGDVPASNTNTNCTKDSLGSCAWWYYVPPNELNQYCQGCNCNGWMNYGVSSTTSTTIMCENPAGTCVPGYDVRNYNARRYDINATNNLDGFPEKYPTVKTPLFVARQFVDFEIEKGDLPQNLPPGWDAFSQGYFIQNGHLYSNLNFFSNGNMFVRTKLAVAGELIAQSTSFSGGQFCYPLSSPGGSYTCGSASTNLNNQPYGTCSVYVNSGDGTLFTIVHNTGTQVGTYTILGNCTNGASLQASFDFSVAPNEYQTVNVPLNYVTTTGETVVCTIGLYLAFTDFRIDTIQYQCPKFQNAFDAPGTQVYGTVDNPTGGIYNPPYSPPSSGNSCDGDDPPWYCFKFRSIGHLMGTLFGFLAIILFITLMIIGFSNCDRLLKRYGREEDLKTKRERKVLRAKVVQTDNEIKATEEEERLSAKIDKESGLRQEIVDEILKEPSGSTVSK